MSDNVNIIVQDTINEIVVNTAVVVETIDINVQVAVDEVNIIANPNNYVVNINRIIGEQVQSDWNQNDDQEPDYIKNKPSIPTLTSDLTNDGEDGINPFITANDVTPQVNSDWNATSGVAEILNKPSIPSIAGLATVVYVDQQDALKVDKVVGKGLSENDFTNTLKTKLDGIESGAQVNVNADWNATTGDAEILNKPTIPAAQVNSDWNATSGVEEILNKPSIPTLTSDLINDGEDGINPFITAADLPISVTSVGLTMPSAFNVANSPITSAGTLAVTGAGVVSQYVRGDGSLANFPTSTGGGASVSYYLNGSVSQGTIGGVAYKEINGVPVIGTGTDFTINADGYIAQFITDVGDPNKLLIPAGNWNFETYFSASSGGGSPRFYIELYKYNGSTFTLISSNSATPENITGGTSIDLYFTALAVPPTTLLATDRLAVRFYVIHSGRTITMHTENSHLSQIITTFSTGLTALNGLTTQVQSFATGTSGTDFGISSATSTHTFNLPTASATNRGALSTTDWSTFNGKQNALTNPITGTGTINYLPKFSGTGSLSNSIIYDTGSRIGIGSTGINIRFEVFSNQNYAGPTLGSKLVGTSSILSSNGLYGLYTGVSDTGSTWIQSQRNDTATAYNINLQPSGGNVLINTTIDNGGKFQIKAPGALSTDIALRLRNSADSLNLMFVNGLAQTAIGQGTATLTNMLTVQDVYSTSVGIELRSDQNPRVGSTFNTSRILSGYSSSTESFLDLQYAGGAYPYTYTTGLRLNSLGNVGIGTTSPAASSKLDITSTTQGVLFPRMTTTQKNAIASPATGLVVFDTTLNKLCVRGASAWETITSI